VKVLTKCNQFEISGFNAGVAQAGLDHHRHTPGQSKRVLCDGNNRTGTLSGIVASVRQILPEKVASKYI
jgi:hypothetical protein